jgi:hypothetical protein
MRAQLWIQRRGSVVADRNVTAALTMTLEWQPLDVFHVLEAGIFETAAVHSIS